MSDRLPLSGVINYSKITVNPAGSPKVTWIKPPPGFVRLRP